MRGIDRLQRDVIVHGDADHAAGAGHVAGDMALVFEASGEVVHRAGAALVEPLAEVVAVARGRGIADTDEVEAHSAGALLDPGHELRWRERAGEPRHDAIRRSMRWRRRSRSTCSSTPVTPMLIALVPSVLI